jgi:hypothetical protein
MDGMRSGILLYSADGLYLDTVFVTSGGAPGYRKNYKFGDETVYTGDGENFGYGQVYLDKASGKVFAAFGKVTMEGFELEGWSKHGIATTPIQFANGGTVQLKHENIAAPPGIAFQIRGYPPVGSTLPVVRTKEAPALDGSLVGWETATAAKYAIDGLNVEQAAQIETRLMYDADTIFVHWYASFRSFVLSVFLPFVLSFGLPIARSVYVYRSFRLLLDRPSPSLDPSRYACASARLV